MCGRNIRDDVWSQLQSHERFLAVGNVNPARFSKVTQTSMKLSTVTRKWREGQWQSNRCMRRSNRVGYRYCAIRRW